MESLMLYLGMGLTALAATTVLGLIGLKGFTAWLDLKRTQIASAMGDDVAVATPTIGQRIDVADLKERVRRLEAIAAGVDI
jgi:hypothetical protein